MIALRNLSVNSTPTWRSIILRVIYVHMSKSMAGIRWRLNFPIYCSNILTLTLPLLFHHFHLHEPPFISLRRKTLSSLSPCSNLRIPTLKRYDLYLSIALPLAISLFVTWLHLPGSVYDFRISCAFMSIVHASGF